MVHGLARQRLPMNPADFPCQEPSRVTSPLQRRKTGTNEKRDQFYPLAACLLLPETQGAGRRWGWGSALNRLGLV
jgi:hypothetical protein